MKKTWGLTKETINEYSDLTVVIILGILLRLKSIVRDDFWYDEAFTGLMAKIPWAEFKEILRLDPHPPLYLVLVRGWSMVVGNSDFTLRLLPMIFGLLTLILIFLVSKELFEKKTAIIVTFLSAINPFLIVYSIEARSYSLFAFMVLLTFYFCIRERKLSFLFSSIIMINVHFMGILFLPGLFLSYIYFNYFKFNKKLGMVLIKELAYLLPIVIVTLFLINDSMNLKDILNIEWARDSSFWLIPRSFTAYLFGVKSRMAGVDQLTDFKLHLNILYIGFGIFAFFLGGFIYQLKKASSQERIMNLILFVNMLLPQIILISYGIYKGENLYVERYLIPCSLFMIIILGSFLTQRIRFESMAIILILYVAILSRQVLPNYYKGMKLLSKELRYIPNELVFTKPADYIIAKYYMYDKRDQVLIHDPEFPDWDYTWWPFISEESVWKPEYLDDGSSKPIFVIPRRGPVPENFQPMLLEEGFGDYNLYLGD